MWYFINNSGRTEIPAAVTKQILAARKAYRKTDGVDAGSDISAWGEIQTAKVFEPSTEPANDTALGLFRKTWRSRR